MESEGCWPFDRVCLVGTSPSIGLDAGIVSSAVQFILGYGEDVAGRDFDDDHHHRSGYRNGVWYAADTRFRGNSSSDDEFYVSIVDEM